VKRRILLLLASLYVCTTTFADTKPTDIMKADEVAQLKIANAESAAKSAVAQGDRRLLAIRGYTIEIPGVRGETTALRAKYGIRMLEGTSDAYENQNSQQINENARKYASIYNRVVIAESAK
jgi:hypothetical protein